MEYNRSVNIFKISNLPSLLAFNFHKNKDVTTGECEAKEHFFYHSSITASFLPSVGSEIKYTELTSHQHNIIFVGFNGQHMMNS